MSAETVIQMEAVFCFGGVAYFRESGTRKMNTNGL
jgi:hypothetical protein